MFNVPIGMICTSTEIPLQGLSGQSPWQVRDIRLSERSAKPYATLAGIERFERSDACLKTDDEPDIFSRSN